MRVCVKPEVMIRDIFTTSPALSTAKLTDIPQADCDLILITARANAPPENSASFFDNKVYSSWSRTSLDLILNTSPSGGKLTLILLQFRTVYRLDREVLDRSVGSSNGCVL